MYLHVLSSQKKGRAGELALAIKRPGTYEEVEAYWNLVTSACKVWGCNFNLLIVQGNVFRIEILLGWIFYFLIALNNVLNLLINVLNLLINILNLLINVFNLLISYWEPSVVTVKFNEERPDCKISEVFLMPLPLTADFPQVPN